MAFRDVTPEKPPVPAPKGIREPATLKDRCFLTRPVATDTVGHPGHVMGFVGPNHTLVEFHDGACEQRIVSIAEMADWVFFDNPSEQQNEIDRRKALRVRK